jgi:hypothetical protein
MKKLLIAIVLMFLTACTNPEGATAVLKEQGYTNIEITGYDFLANGKDDVSSTGFIATTATGVKVKGAVTDKGSIGGIFRPRWNVRIWKKLN